MENEKHLNIFGHDRTRWRCMIASVIQHCACWRLFDDYFRRSDTAQYSHPVFCIPRTSPTIMPKLQARLTTVIRISKRERDPLLQWGTDLKDRPPRCQPLDQICTTLAWSGRVQDRPGSLWAYDTTKKWFHWLMSMTKCKGPITSIYKQTLLTFALLFPLDTFDY